MVTANHTQKETVMEQTVEIDVGSNVMDLTLKVKSEGCRQHGQTTVKLDFDGDEYEITIVAIKARHRRDVEVGTLR